MKNVIIRGIKIVDIGFITAIYLTFGLVLAKLCDHILGEFDEEKEKQKPLWQVLIELFFYLWFIGVVVYVVRNVVQLIPFPFHGVYGYDHFRVKELINAVIFFTTFLNFQDYYQKKIKSLFDRL
jgi:K+-transporting ATPase A subunit